MSDNKKILIIGSGPIVIGQAAEFDYSCTQACIVLKHLGYKTILINNNPATIMTDKDMSNKLYMQDINIKNVKKIIKREKPYAILPGLGGQTSLNLVSKLYKMGFLKKYNVKLLGTDFITIELTENRSEFKNFCEKLNIPTIPSNIATSIDEINKKSDKLKLPVILRPAYTLGGYGSSLVQSNTDIEIMGGEALSASPINQVLVEKSVCGFLEVEFEMMRDCAGNTICVCGMENIDPCGVHTGDSIVVAPIISLSKKQISTLIEISKKIANNLDIVGGCNIQFAVENKFDNSEYNEEFNYYVIEVNPRVSRSSALASKASSYPIAKIATFLSLGYRLKDIKIGHATADTEPQLNYKVIKFPKFAFDKFPDIDNTLTTQMKATGEVMSIGENFEICILKAICSLDKYDNNKKLDYLELYKFKNFSTSSLFNYIKEFNHDNFFAIAQIFRNLQTNSKNERLETIKKIWRNTKIPKFFLEHISNIVKTEKQLILNKWNYSAYIKAKEFGFSDRKIAELWCTETENIGNFKNQNNIKTCFIQIGALGKDNSIPYFYSSYNQNSKTKNIRNLKLENSIVVIGSGPIRIGQSIEFDYCTVQAIKTIQQIGYNAITINNNPETVSTDYSISDKLYFEPLDFEHVKDILKCENPKGVILQFGGQTAINLYSDIDSLGYNILGTSLKSTNITEDRAKFQNLCLKLSVNYPKSFTANSIKDALRKADNIGYPVIIKPSYVIGGFNVVIAEDKYKLEKVLKSSNIDFKHNKIFIDKFIEGTEIDVDAVCDGQDVFVPSIIEHVDPSGIHSGDSKAIIPAKSLNFEVIKIIFNYTKLLATALNIVGLCNIQFVIDKNKNVYVLELNPRSSRTIPLNDKACDLSMSDIATKVILGSNLKSEIEQLSKFKDITKIENCYTINNKSIQPKTKIPVFSNKNLGISDLKLGPSMISTGEIII